MVAIGYSGREGKSMHQIVPYIDLNKKIMRVEYICL